MRLCTENLSLSGRLNDVSTRLRSGEVTAICGPNGAGKSSLIAALAGLVAPEQGQVALDGLSLDYLRGEARAQVIGYLPQTPEIAWDVTVEVLVGLGRLPWPDAPADEARKATDAAIETMDLAPFRQRAVSRLSGGEKARALMARVLATNPSWILADEPLAALDLAHAAALMRKLREEAVRGRGVVLVMHDLAMAMNHADRVLVLDGGVLVADGAPDEALSTEVIGDVWKVPARWLGEPGARALSLT